MSQRRHAIDPVLLQELIVGLESGDIVIQSARTESSGPSGVMFNKAGDVISHRYGERRIVLEMLDLRPLPALPPDPPVPPPPMLKRHFGQADDEILNSIPEPSGPPHLGVLNKYWIGYRDFKTDLTADGLLQSRNAIAWPPREKLIATCTKQGVSHDPPVLECECGIYAYEKPDNQNLKADGGIWGEVALWGETVRCEWGYRAEYAYPLSLFMKDYGTKAVRRLQAQLTDTYGIPVILVDHRNAQTASEIMQVYIDAVIEDTWRGNA